MAVASVQPTIWTLTQVSLFVLMSFWRYLCTWCTVYENKHTLYIVSFYKLQTLACFLFPFIVKDKFDKPQNGWLGVYCAWYLILCTPQYFAKCDQTMQLSYDLNKIHNFQQFNCRISHSVESNSEIITLASL